MLAGPRDLVETLTCAPQREVVPNHAEREVVRDEVGAGNEEQETRADKPQRVDDQPEAVFLEVASELPPDQRRCLALLEVVRKKQARVALPAQVPEKSLFRDAFGDPSEGNCFSPREGSLGLLRRMAAPPLALIDCTQMSW